MGAQVRFGEDRRRRLHQLQGRHKVWVADAAKFINMYGGSVAADFDLEPLTTSTGGYCSLHLEIDNAHKCECYGSEFRKRVN